MVPPKTHPRFAQLATGQIPHAFGLVSAGMFVALHQRKVQTAGRSPAAVAAAVDEIHAFFTKYEVAIAGDIKAIFG